MVGCARKRLRTGDSRLDRRTRWPASTQIPKSCPICCSTSFVRMMNDTLLSAKPEGLAPHMLEVVAYQCDNAHVFLLVAEGFWWKQPHKSGAGYEITM